jgi:hypothetical protein
MSGKSRHGKGRRFHYSKKSKALRRQGTTATVSPASTGAPDKPQPARPAATPAVPKAAVAMAKGTVNPYPYIAGELRRIVILGISIIIIVIVLSIVLS